MTTPLRPWHQSALLLFAAMLLVVGQSGSLAAWAALEKVTLKELGAEETIYLPTVRAQRELLFTKPLTWNLSNATVQVVFQHSTELIPGSWLQVILNDKQLKHIPLTKANADSTTVQVSLPVAQLKDFNRLTLRVEQHYTKVCEDPLDPSLWTNVLGKDSHIAFTYSPKVPALKLQQFPFPLVDSTTYNPLPIRFVLPQAVDGATAQAMARLNTTFAQAMPREPLRTSAQLANQAIPAAPEHLVILGTPDALGNAAKATLAQLNLPGYRLQGGQWTGLNDGEAVVAMAPRPGQPGALVLVISGNSSEAVERGASFLVHEARQSGQAAGPVAVVPSSWNPPEPMNLVAPIVSYESRTFEELGYDTQSVEKIVAPPLTFNIPVATRFAGTDAELVLDLLYSYSAELNPRYSSLELRLNDYPVANLPLMNEQGEERVQAQVTLPKDLIRADNKLVAQFHLMPDKHGYCVDTYVDNSWGKIHPDSAIRVTGTPASALPDIALLNQANGYPYTNNVQLADTRIQLAQADLPSLETLLALTSRLGRLSHKAAGSYVTVGIGDGEDGNSQNLVLIDTRPSISGGPGDRFRLGLDAQQNVINAIYGTKGVKAQLLLPAGNEESALIEQLTTGNDRVVTRLAATTPQAMQELANVLEQDPLFEALPHGALVRVEPSVEGLRAVDEQLAAGERAGTTAGGARQASAGGNWLLTFWNTQPWLRWTVYAVGALLLLFAIVPFVLGLLRRRR